MGVAAGCSDGGTPGDGNEDDGPSDGDVNFDDATDTEAPVISKPENDVASGVDTSTDAEAIADTGIDTEEDIETEPDTWEIEDVQPDSGEDADAQPDGEESEVDGTEDAWEEEDIGLPEEDVPEEEPVDLFYPGATLLDESTFPLGVQSGSATSTSIHLWTVLAGEGPWRLVVFGDGSGNDPGEIVVEGPVTPVEYDTAHVDVTYLPSGTWFRYCFVLDDVEEGSSIPRSPIGRFRTAPAPGELEVISFGGISCNNISYSSWDPLFHAADSALDFFLWAGDTVYADGSNSLEDFRSVWREYLDDPSYRAIMQATSTLATWDDHEVTNNWDPETLNPQVIQAATDAFFEHLPIRRDPDAPDRVWRSHRWGDTLEVFVLDCRSERLPSTQGENGTYISQEQMDWLKGALSDSPCVFKLILNSVPITNMPFLFDLGADDSWVGYNGQREDILSYISDNVDGVIWLAGDFHMGAVTHVEGDDSPHYNQMEVLMGPGGQFSNPGWFLLESGPQASQYNFATPNFNFVRFIADPLSQPPVLIVEFVGSDGEVFYEDAIEV